MGKSPRQRTAIRKIERLLSLVAFLLKTRRPVPFREIREQVNGYRDEAPDDVLIRRFERDKRELRELGIPIEYSDRGYKIPKDRYSLAPFELTGSDAVLVRTLARLAAGGPLPEEEVRAAVQKLACDTNGARAGDIEEKELIVMLPGEESDEASKERFLLLTQAIGEKRPVEFSYPGPTGEKLLVEPYGLGLSGGCWQLVGCLRGGALRAFRIDMIDGLDDLETREEMGQPFELPDDFDIADFLGREDWELGEEAPIRVEVDFDAEYAWHVRATLPRKASFSDLDDGGGRASFRVCSLDPFLRWLLPQLGRVRAVRPTSVREALLQTLDGVEALYGGGAP